MGVKRMITENEMGYLILAGTLDALPSPRYREFSVEFMMQTYRATVDTGIDRISYVKIYPVFSDNGYEGVPAEVREKLIDSVRTHIRRNSFAISSKCKIPIYKN